MWLVFFFLYRIKGVRWRCGDTWNREQVTIRPDYYKTKFDYVHQIIPVIIFSIRLIETIRVKYCVNSS